MYCSQYLTKSIISNESLGFRYGLNALQGGYGLQKVPLASSSIAGVCPPVPRCQFAAQLPYRTFDGSCNNLQRPTWGQSNTAMQRILPPTYNDGKGYKWSCFFLVETWKAVLRVDLTGLGIWDPRSLSVTGQPLPSARLISTASFDTTDRPDDHLTLLVMQWGQFLDHDITHAGVFKLGNWDKHYLIN